MRVVVVTVVPGGMGGGAVGRSRVPTRGTGPGQSHTTVPTVLRKFPLFWEFLENHEIYYFSGNFWKIMKFTKFSGNLLSFLEINEVVRH